MAISIHCGAECGPAADRLISSSYVLVAECSYVMHLAASGRTFGAVVNVAIIKQRQQWLNPPHHPSARSIPSLHSFVRPFVR